MLTADELLVMESVAAVEQARWYRVMREAGIVNGEHQVQQTLMDLTTRRLLSRSRQRIYTVTDTGLREMNQSYRAAGKAAVTASEEACSSPMESSSRDPLLF